MMKLGCMSLSLPGLDLDAFIEVCYRMQLDVIELHTRAFPSTDPNTLRAIKMKCLRKGLPIGYLGISNDFGKPETEHPELDTGQYAGSPGASGQSEAQYDCYRSMEQTVAHAVYVRAKFYRIDSGVEEWLDYPRIVRMLKNAGYNGCLSIVYEGHSEPRPAIEKAACYLRSLL
jgi:sugar phosphate isomerase/epimerase